MVESFFDEERRVREAHAAAAERLGGHAAVAYRMLYVVAYDVLSNEVDFVPLETNPGGQRYDWLSDAMGSLRAIWTGHPTEEVRQMARELSEKVQSLHGAIGGDGVGAAPRDQDELVDQITGAEKLIEVIHTAPPREQPPPRILSARHRIVTFSILAVLFLVAAILSYSNRDDDRASSTTSSHPASPSAE